MAVRQQQHERRPEPPLAARRDDELVDHDLRAVDEVAVLRFPDHEPRRLLDVVAVLESDDGVLGERAVVDLEGGARLRQRLQRHVDPPCDGVVEHRMAMAEGAALDVLAGQPDADAVGEDRRVGQFLGARPVDRALVWRVEELPLLLAHAFELAMNREVAREDVERRVQLAQPFERHARGDARGRAGRRRLGCRFDEVLLGCSFS